MKKILILVSLAALFSFSACDAGIFEESPPVNTEDYSSHSVSEQDNDNANLNLNCKSWAAIRLEIDTYVADIPKDGWNINQSIYEYFSNENASGTVRPMLLQERIYEPDYNDEFDPGPAWFRPNPDQYEISEDCVYTLSDENGNIISVEPIEFTGYPFGYRKGETVYWRRDVYFHKYMENHLNGDIWEDQGTGEKYFFSFASISKGEGVILKKTPEGELVDFGIIKYFGGGNTIRNTYYITFTQAQTSTKWEVRMEDKDNCHVFPPSGEMAWKRVSDE